MTYDLSNKAHRKQIVTRVNNYLKKKSGLLTITDDSVRTLNQNKYLHVLIRMLALETGVQEDYAKEMYFKRLANPNLFVKTRFDSLSGKDMEYTVSSSALTTEEMSKAIDSFRRWSESNGYYLPEAHYNDETHEYEFSSTEDKLAFEKGIVDTSRADKWL